VTICAGFLGPCAWSVVEGELDQETMERFLSHLREVGENAVPGQLVLDMCHDLPMPTPVQRRRIVEVLEGSPKLDRVAGHALVINSTIGRGLLTAINWVVSPRFEEKLFARPERAFAWLVERNPDFDADALLEAVRAAHPGFDALSW
jgi:hypothetical protein